MSAKEILEVIQIVVTKRLDSRLQCSGNTAVIAVGVPTVRPTAIAVVENYFALGVGAGDACRRIIRLGAAFEKTYHFGGRYGVDEAVCRRDL